MPVQTATRELTFNGLVKVVIAIAEAESSPTRMKKRLSVAEVSAMGAVPEANYLEAEGLIRKVGDGADFPIGYNLRTRGREYANELVTSAAELYNKKFKSPKPQEEAAQQPAAQQTA